MARRCSRGCPATTTSFEPGFVNDPIPMSIESGGAALDDAGWALDARKRLAAGQAQRVQRFDTGEAVEKLLVARSHDVDAVVLEAWSRVCGDCDALHLIQRLGEDSICQL